MSDTGKIRVSAVDLALRFVGVHELPGPEAEPTILWFLRSCDESVTQDEVPWCSGFANRVAWLLDLPRSRSLRARSWLKVGQPVEPIANARIGFDVVVLKRGTNDAGPEFLAAPGHVGFFHGFDGERVRVLGGNQGDAVTVATYPISRVLGVRRLWGRA